MRATVSHLWRHPIKGHGVEAVPATVLAAGATMPWDRVWAIAQDRAKLGDGASWVPCVNFGRGAKSPALMAIRARTDEAAGTVTLTHPRARAADRRSRRCRGRRAADRLGRAALEPGPAGAGAGGARARRHDRQRLPVDRGPQPRQPRRARRSARPRPGDGALPRQRLARRPRRPGRSSTSSAARSASAAPPCGCARSSPAARPRRSIPIPASRTPTPSARSRRAGATRTSGSTPRWSRAGASPSAIAWMPGRDLARPSPGGRAAPASASRGISYRQKSYRAVAGPRQQAGRKLLAAGTAAPAEGGRNGGRPPSGDRAGGALARLPEADAPPTPPHAAREMKVTFTEAPAPDAEALEAGRRLFAGPVEFLKGVVAMDGLPPADRAEVCFAGRSNVGKSSLINALVGRKSLARASNTPGRTQEINFFTLGERHYLVDLPGYGFAEAPKPVVERWQALLRAYLAGRPTLRRAFLLIDARHGPKPRRRRDHGAARPLGGHLPGGADQGRQAVGRRPRRRGSPHRRRSSPGIRPPSRRSSSPRPRRAPASTPCAPSSRRSEPRDPYGFHTRSFRSRRLSAFATTLRAR